MCLLPKKQLLHTPKWKKKRLERHARRRRKKRRIVLKRVARIEWVVFSERWNVKDFYLRTVVVKFNVKFLGRSYTLEKSHMDLQESIGTWSMFFLSIMRFFGVSKFSVQGLYYTWNPNGAPCFDWSERAFFLEGSKPKTKDTQVPGTTIHLQPTFEEPYLEDHPS